MSFPSHFKLFIFWNCFGLEAHKIVLLWPVLLLGLCYIKRIIPVSDPFLFFSFDSQVHYQMSGSYQALSLICLVGDLLHMNISEKYMLSIGSELDLNIVLYDRLNFLYVYFCQHYCSALSLIIIFGPLNNRYALKIFYLILLL